MQLEFATNMTVSCCNCVVKCSTLWLNCVEQSEIKSYTNFKKSMGGRCRELIKNNIRRGHG